MARNIPKTRVVVAGTDITDAVLSTTATRHAGDVEVLSLVVVVDRLELTNDLLNGGQTLTYHVAEEETD